MAIKSKNIHPKTPARYHRIERVVSGGTSNVSAAVVGSWPFEATGLLKEVIIVHESVGAGGTSMVITPKIGSTALCSTNPAFTRAGGAGAVTSGTGITGPTGSTKPVLKSAMTITKGQKITIDTTHTGSYSTAPTFNVIFLIEPQVY